MEDPQQKQKEKKPKRASPQLVCVVACLYIAIPLVAYATYYMQTVPFISCSKHQQLVRKTPRFMPAETFAEMKKCFEDHPLTGESVLNQNAFSSTRGFVIGFNREGVADFKGDGRFDCMTKYFDRAAIHDANAFVMNLLVCHQPTNTSDVVVGLHIDNTLKSWLPLKTFYAHQVNVLYMNVPEDMQGGTLEVFSYRDGVEVPVDNPGIPDLEVHPEENTMVAFRGDAYHRVRGYETSTTQRRISLVLEQYKTPWYIYPFTVRFSFYAKQGVETM